MKLNTKRTPRERNNCIVDERDGWRERRSVLAPRFCAGKQFFHFLKERVT
jgi:hypothetical protein